MADEPKTTPTGGGILDIAKMTFEEILEANPSFQARVNDIVVREADKAVRRAKRDGGGADPNASAAEIDSLRDKLQQAETDLSKLKRELDKSAKEKSAIETVAKGWEGRLKQQASRAAIAAELEALGVVKGAREFVADAMVGKCDVEFDDDGKPQITLNKKPLNEALKEQLATRDDLLTAPPSNGTGARGSGTAPGETGILAKLAEAKRTGSAVTMTKAELDAALTEAGLAQKGRSGVF